MKMPPVVGYGYFLESPIVMFILKLIYYFIILLFYNFALLSHFLIHYANAVCLCLAEKETRGHLW